MKRYKGDCLEVMDKLIADGVVVDAIITDPPYGTIKNIGKNTSGFGMKKQNNNMWDTEIDTGELFIRADKLLKKGGRLVLFGQEPYTSSLIQHVHPNLPFNYKMIWSKRHFANCLVAGKAPVNYFEDIMVFTKKHDMEAKNNIELRKYGATVIKYINKSKKEIVNIIGQKIDHFLRISSSQFSLCTEETYGELIDVFGIDEMEGFRPFSELRDINIIPEPTFNLHDGEKIKSNILEYKKDFTGHHPTQKPVALMEDLIKTYTNEGELVLDFTMGSGTTGVACKNTNRDFIGIELDDTYFDIAKERIDK